MIGALQSTTQMQRPSWGPLGGAGSATSTSATASSTASEQSDPLSQLFAALDGDASGGASSSELQTFVDQMASGTRGALLSVQEEATASAGTSTAATGSTTTAASELFSSIDGDGDGSISAEELSTHMQANMPPPPPPPGGPDGGDGASGDASSTSAQDPATAMFATLDADGDGSVTASEIETMLSSGDTTTDAASDAATILAAMDADGDGAVSETELADAMKADAPPPPPPPPSEAVSATATSASSSSGGSSGTSSDAVSSIDTNQDGLISQAELQAFFNGGDATTTSTTGTTSTASSLVAQLLQQTYQRLQATRSDSLSTLLSGLDSVA